MLCVSSVRLQNIFFCRFFNYFFPRSHILSVFVIIMLLFHLQMFKPTRGSRLYELGVTDDCVQLCVALKTKLYLKLLFAYFHFQKRDKHKRTKTTPSPVLSQSNLCNLNSAGKCDLCPIIASTGIERCVLLTEMCDLVHNERSGNAIPFLRLPNVFSSPAGQMEM